MASVKICGITDGDGDPGGRGRGRRRDRPQPRAGHATRAGAATKRPASPDSPASSARRPRRCGSSPITADASPDAARRHRPRDRPGRRPAVRRREAGGGGRARRPTWKVLHVPRDPGSDPAAAPGSSSNSGRAYLAAGAEALLLDAAGGPHPGGTGQRADESIARSVARELPVMLAGGLAPANVAEALRAIAAIGVDVASGVGAAPPARRAAAQGPVRGGAVRQACPRRPLRPSAVAVAPDAGRPRPARRRRRAAAGARRVSSAAATCRRR